MPVGWKSTTSIIKIKGYNHGIIFKKRKLFSHKSVIWKKWNDLFNSRFENAVNCIFNLTEYTLKQKRMSYDKQLPVTFHEYRADRLPSFSNGVNHADLRTTMRDELCLYKQFIYFG